ncbi:MAG: acyl-CoA thioesterase [Betaproteobacteria bacterium]|nr:acyl-CoA thioesterase [Betaproteobacteria bacterium]
MTAETTAGALLSTLRFPIRWGDMDALEHVNNTLYMRYFEESRIEWSTRIGLRLHRAGVGMILARAAIDFKKPVTYPSNVIVELRAGAIGRSSFTLLNTLTVEGEAAPSAVGECVCVWFDYIAQKSLPVPDFLRDILNGKSA